MLEHAGEENYGCPSHGLIFPPCSNAKSQDSFLYSTVSAGRLHTAHPAPASYSQLMQAPSLNKWILLLQEQYDDDMPCNDGSMRMLANASRVFHRARCVCMSLWAWALAWVWAAHAIHAIPEHRSFSSFLNVYPVHPPLHLRHISKTISQTARPLSVPSLSLPLPVDFVFLFALLLSLCYCYRSHPAVPEPRPPWQQRPPPPQGSESPPPVLPFRPFRALSALASPVPSTSVPQRALARVISKPSSRAFPSTCERRKSSNANLETSS